MAQSIDPVGRHFPLKLGKKPARPGAVKFKLANFLVKTKLPTPPKVFGHQDLIGGNGRDAAGTVLHDRAPVFTLRQFLGNDPADDVGRSARGERGDETNRAGRKCGLGACR